MTEFTTAPPAINVLLVEDCRTDAMLLQAALVKSASPTFRVYWTASLQGALVLLAENTFDIALLDHHLPDANGFNALHALHHMMPKLPVVFMAEESEEELALEAVREGAQDYLLKGQIDTHSVTRAIRLAIQRRSYEEELIRLAHFDALTGLAGRHLLENRLDLSLARAKRNGGGIGLFFLDLNSFKQVNDSLGHAAGDLLLQQVAERIKRVMRPYDTPARFGGDEFALLAEGIRELGDCVVIAEKIIDAIGKPYRLNGLSSPIGVSIGISSCLSGQQRERTEMLREADMAMYSAKREKTSCFRFYAAEFMAA